MLDPDVLAFVSAALPAPPADVLEIGAGDGELAAELRSGGYDVRAIDPAAADGSGVLRAGLLDAAGTFDAAVAVVALHHVEPLEASCAHLATLLRDGGMLVLDEFDVALLDERAAAWWLDRRRERGAAEERDADEIIAFMRHHVHALSAMREALRPHFTLREAAPGPYLYRWNLGPELRAEEEQLIAAGELPATGARLVGARRPAS